MNLGLPITGIANGWASENVSGAKPTLQSGKSTSTAQANFAVCFSACAQDLKKMVKPVVSDTKVDEPLFWLEDFRIENEVPESPEKEWISDKLARIRKLLREIKKNG